MDISEVIAGLKKGHGFVFRASDGDGGSYEEYLLPSGPTEFHHSVSGTNSQGGYGGNATLDMSLLPGRFEPTGWEQLPGNHPAFNAPQD